MEPSAKLSSREMEVVRLLQAGKSNKLIASSLNISESTVEFHLKNIYAKYQVSSRVELILKLGESTGAGKLGDSTVAGKEEKTENDARLNISNWSTSLRAAVSRIGKEFEMQKVMDSNARSSGTSMTFFESIIVCLRKFADFNGRASRAEFWWFTLAVVLVASALTYLSQALGSAFLVLVLLPQLAAGARRLQDTGKSRWWLLFILAPVGGIMLLGILWAAPSSSSQPDDSIPA